MHLRVQNRMTRSAQIVRGRCRASTHPGCVCLAASAGPRSAMQPSKRQRTVTMSAAAGPITLHERKPRLSAVAHNPLYMRVCREGDTSVSSGAITLYPPAPSSLQACEPCAFCTCAHASGRKCHVLVPSKVFKMRTGACGGLARMRAPCASTSIPPSLFAMFTSPMIVTTRQLPRPEQAGIAQARSSPVRRSALARWSTSAQPCRPDHQ